MLAFANKYRLLKKNRALKWHYSTSERRVGSYSLLREMAPLLAACRHGLLDSVLPRFVFLQSFQGLRPKIYYVLIKMISVQLSTKVCKYLSLSFSEMRGWMEITTGDLGAVLTFTSSPRAPTPAFSSSALVNCDSRSIEKGHLRSRCLSASAFVCVLL